MLAAYGFQELQSNAFDTIPVTVLTGKDYIVFDGEKIKRKKTGNMMDSQQSIQL